MDKLIRPNQTAFLKGRLLVDSVVAIKEVVNLSKIFKKDCVIFKVDFEKAYNSISWSFFWIIWFSNLVLMISGDLGLEPVSSLAIWRF